MGIRSVGVVGILIEAKRGGLIEAVKPVLDEVQGTGCKKIIERLKERYE
ncbi:DUF3368 domain-containing protein, partial [uncultured Thiodictyon sp.]